MADDDKPKTAEGAPKEKSELADAEKEYHEQQGPENETSHGRQQGEQADI